MAKQITGTGDTYNALIEDALDHAHNELCESCRFPQYRKWVSWSLVANDPDYAMPSDLVAPINVTYKWGKQELRNVEYSEHANISGNSPFRTSSEPTSYMRHDMSDTDYMRVFAVPSTAAVADSLNGAINDTVTTITLNDVSNFQPYGRVIINSEVIEYKFVDTTNNQLEQCVRGVEGTTAASHSNTDVVTERDLQMFYFHRPAALDTDASEPLYPETYHMSLVFYMCHIIYLAMEKFEQAALHFQEWSAIKSRAVEQTALERINRINDMKHHEFYPWSTEP
jgi:hypothetical protein